MTVEEWRKVGKPGLIHLVNGAKWTQGGRRGKVPMYKFVKFQEYITESVQLPYGFYTRHLDRMT